MDRVACACDFVSTGSLKLEDSSDCSGVERIMQGRLQALYLDKRCRQETLINIAIRENKQGRCHRICEAGMHSREISWKSTWWRRLSSTADAHTAASLFFSLTHHHRRSLCICSSQSCLRDQSLLNLPRPTSASSSQILYSDRRISRHRRPHSGLFC